MGTRVQKPTFYPTYKELKQRYILFKKWEEIAFYPTYKELKPVNRRTDRETADLFILPIRN